MPVIPLEEERLCILVGELGAVAANKLIRFPLKPNFFHTSSSSIEHCQKRGEKNKKKNDSEEKHQLKYLLLKIGIRGHSLIKIKYVKTSFNLIIS